MRHHPRRPSLSRAPWLPLLTAITLAAAPAAPAAAQVARPAAARRPAAPLRADVPVGIVASAGAVLAAVPRVAPLGGLPASPVRRRQPKLGAHLLGGLLVGTGVGLVVGVVADRECYECMIPMTPFTTAGGAVLGLAGGALVYAVRRAPRPDGGT
jgi:hypothetical protein